MSTRFIAMEGLDGSGGTTQIAMLKAAFEARGEPVIVTREPSDRPVGALIRDHLRRSWQDVLGDGVFPYLFAADRRDHLDCVVLPALARGENVLSDRYALSSFAYQAEAHGLDRVMRLNQDFPAPDLTIMLDLAPAMCLDRILARGSPRDRFEALDQLNTIAAGYEAAIRAVSWPIVRIDANGTPAQIAAAIAALVWPNG
ncbi:MAG: dTMP kinase [Myxococcales bacterium]|nr:dTMP kinase [Myxococcales bacterium]